MNEIDHVTRYISHIIWYMAVPRGFSEERKCILPVLNGCIMGPDMREALEPHEPRSIDLPGHLDRNRIGSQNVCGTHNEHDILLDTGKAVIGPVPREICLCLFVDALQSGWGLIPAAFNNPVAIFWSRGSGCCR